MMEHQITEDKTGSTGDQPTEVKMEVDKTVEEKSMQDKPAADKTTGTAGHACAMIKPQYIDTSHKYKLADKFMPKAVAEELSVQVAESHNGNDDQDPAASSDEPKPKRPKLKGRNKKRPIEKNPDAKDKICPQVLTQQECRFGDKCRFMHDVEKFMAEKPQDLGDTCYNYQTYGKCDYSFACRFASQHLTSDNQNKINEQLYDQLKKQKTVLNILDRDLQKLLWKRKYDFSRSDMICKTTKAQLECATSGPKPKVEVKARNCSDDVNKMDVTTTSTDSPPNDTSSPGVKEGGLDAPHPRGRDRKEKATIEFKDKLYLAPLTTLGNLPFRRICKGLGADITCGEMAMCPNLLQGQQSEWALLKRHASEDIFGIQLCGSYPDVMSRCAQIICENLDADFIDINCGCPIDLVFKKGEGSALMGRTSRFQHIIKSMTSVMDIPLTAKIRTGIYEAKNTAHTLLPCLRDWGLSMVTLHGRSREQRYTRLADWEYINTCAQAASPMPLFGNGDILSYEDYEWNREHTGVSGAMVARGALIKPWIFTEIKEHRHWDISSSERLDMLRNFANFGLEHWGSDQQGVTTTRRFLLEWLSFLYRYIPVGLLERLPQKINEKPPHYFGRDDLETLMASPNCADWIKISEMLLGPVPSGFVFLPKHKANSYQ